MKNHEFNKKEEPTSYSENHQNNETWEEHIRFAEKIKQRFKHEKKEANEKPKNSSYLLSEHIDPHSAPFGKPRSSKKEDIKFAKKWWNDVCEDWDGCGIELPSKLGEGIEKIVNDENYFFGIHRSFAINGSDFENDETLHSILTNGLQNLGDVSGGAVYNDPPVSKTVSPCANMLSAVINLKSSYKGSTGAVLVVIPSEFCDKATGRIKEGMEDEVYIHNKLGNSFLKPEFILGFVQNLGEGSTLIYESREQILDAYDKNKTDQQ